MMQIATSPDFDVYPCHISLTEFALRLFLLMLVSLKLPKVKAITNTSLYHVMLDLCNNLVLTYVMCHVRTSLCLAPRILTCSE